MAVKGTHLTTNSTSTIATSYNTASISPTANALVLIAVGYGDNEGLPSISSITGCGLTFTHVKSQNSGDGRQTIRLYRALSSSTSTGALTISLNNSPQSMCWTVAQFTNVITTGTNGADAVVQSASAAGEGGARASETVTLSAFSHPLNATFGAIRINNTHAITPGTGFTELGEDDTPHSIQSEWKASNDTTVNWTFGSTSDRDQAVAVEIAAKITGGAFLFNLI